MAAALCGGRNAISETNSARSCQVGRRRAVMDSRQLPARRSRRVPRRHYGGHVAICGAPRHASLTYRQAGRHIASSGWRAVVGHVDQVVLCSTTQYHFFFFFAFAILFPFTYRFNFLGMKPDGIANPKL